MAITIRDLIARVFVFRSADLAEGTDCLWALQESTMDVARYTGICKKVQVPVVLPALTDSILVTPTDTNTHEVIRVLRLRAAEIPYNATLLGVQYLGGWDAASNTPTITSGTAATYGTYTYYLVTTDGTTTVDTLSDWNVGDVIYSDGSSFRRIPLEQYSTIGEAGDSCIRSSMDKPQSVPAFPSVFSQEQGTLSFFGPPRNDIPVELTISYVPMRNQAVDDTAVWPMPVEAENAIVFGAIELLYRLPGSGQNFREADMWRIRYLKERANLKTTAMLGSGVSWYNVGNFSGRSGRFATANSRNGWL